MNCPFVFQDASHPLNNVPAGAIRQQAAYVPPHLRNKSAGGWTFMTRGPLYSTPFNLHLLLSFFDLSPILSSKGYVEYKKYDKNLCWREMMSEFQHSERPSWSLLRPLQSSHNRISRLSRSVRRTGRSGSSRLSSTTFSNSKWAENERTSRVAYCKRHALLKMYDSIRGIEIGQGGLCASILSRTFLDN